MRWIGFDGDGTRTTGTAPAESRPFLQAVEWLLPPIISDLHRSFQQWDRHNLSPGTITPDRVRISQAGTVYFGFAPGTQPAEHTSVGGHRDLAGWLVLLDKVMETYVVIARARSLWTVNELAGALPFITPGLLPPALVALSPDNWEDVARSLAFAVADGPLQGALQGEGPEADAKTNNRHWGDEY